MAPPGAQRGAKSGSRGGGKGFRLASRSGSHAYKGRAQKIKEQLVHKAKVKKDYYKQLAKGDPDLETPDYVKEIFGERTIDDDGNIVDYQSESKRKREDESDDGDDDEDRIHDLDEPSSAEEGSDNESESRDNQRGKFARTARPNPFKKDMEKQHVSKETAQKEREEALKQKEQQQKERKKYYKQRKEVRGKMMARNAKGQPKMGSQINLLLDKIQHDVAVENRKEKKRLKRKEQRHKQGQQQQDLVE